MQLTFQKVYYKLNTHVDRTLDRRGNFHDPKATFSSIIRSDFAHNLGSMIRLCACFGVTLDIIETMWISTLSAKKSKGGIALDYSDQCEMILHSDWSEFKECSKKRRLILLSTKAKRSLWDFKFNLK